MVLAGKGTQYGMEYSNDLSRICQKLDFVIGWAQNSSVRIYLFILLQYILIGVI